MATKYNFDEIINRKGTDSVKWDLAKDEQVLPMWVADTDFKTAPEITEAILHKVSQGVFGYSLLPDDFFDAIINWWIDTHHFVIRKEWILPGPGMIPTLSAILRTFVKADENIIIQPPVYNHFYHLLENCDFGMVENNLICQNGTYQMDFDDLDLKASDPNTSLLLLCNPHNPVGRVWKRSELDRIAEICSKHNVMVVSDEIHADLIFEGHTHIPFAAVAGNYEIQTVTCGSSCKTFNLAGLTISYIISQNKETLNKIHRTFEIQETSYPNPMAATALIAAYRNGKEWMEQLKYYLQDNYNYLLEFCTQHLPEIKIIPLEATYLVWLDCRALDKNSEDLSQILLSEERLWINPGTMYGKAGEGFIRINIACPRKLLTDGLIKLKNGIQRNR